MEGNPSDVDEFTIVLSHLNERSVNFKLTK
jgi:hypothetical protein